MNKERRLQLFLGIASAVSFSLPWHRHFTEDDLRGRMIVGWESPLAMPLAACLGVSLLISALERGIRRRAAFAHLFLFCVTLAGMLMVHVFGAMAPFGSYALSWGAWIYFTLSAGFYAVNFMITGAGVEAHTRGSHDGS